MKKLIEIVQKQFIICDNPNCDYKIPYFEDTKGLIILYINTSCPRCGEILLTKEDYLNHLKLTKAVNFINRWFSWLTLFYSSKTKLKKVEVYTHDGITIKEASE